MTLYRADVELLHRDLAIVSKLCVKALGELHQTSKGRALWPSIERTLMAAAIWRGRLAAAISYGATADAGSRPLHLLDDIDVASYDPTPGVPLDEQLSTTPAARPPLRAVSGGHCPRRA